jgi:CRISPR-associated endonuclease/helicase Cas3
LLDSDEQLAGRINRNSSKEDNKLFLFEMENPKAKYVYKGDKRLDIKDDEVLGSKDFDRYYNLVIEKLKEQNSLNFIENLNSYIDHIKNLRFSETHIKIIDMESISVFVPINLMAKLYFNAYKNIVQNHEMDFTNKKIKIKKLSTKLSNYTFSLANYPESGIKYLIQYGKEEFGYLYLEDWDNIASGRQIYTYRDGLDTSVLKGENVGMFI